LNKKETKAILLSLVIFSILASDFYLPRPAQALSTPTIYVQNPITGTNEFTFNTNTTPVGFRFNATLYVNNGTDIYAWQVRMNYNSAYLNATRAWIAPASDPDYIFSGQSTIRPTPSLTNGSALVGDTMLGLTGVTFTTPKKLGIVELRVMAVPPPGAGSKLSSILNITNVDTFLLDSNLNEISTMKTNGLYELHYSPLATQISISANPAALNYGGNVKINGIISTVPPNPSLKFANVVVSIMHRVGTSGAFTVLTFATTNSTSGYLYTWIASGIVTGLHQFRTSWSGNANYTGSMSGIANVTVTIPAGSPIIYVTNPQTGTSNFTFYTSTTHVGDRFNATVAINNGTDVAAWQVTLNYNATYLNATRAWVPSSDTQYIFRGLSTFPISPVFVTGSVLIGDLTIPTTGVTFTTPKKLAIIEFRVMATPPVGAGNKVSSVLDISNPADTFIIDATTVEIPTVRTNGLYELKSGTKPASQITINASPTTVTVGAIVAMNGTVTTAPDARVTIWHKIGAGAFTNLTTVTTNTSSVYSYSWIGSAAGIHQFKANWTGNDQYLGAESTAVSVTVNKASSTISIVANPTSAKVGEPVALNGIIAPARSNANVTITSGATMLGTITTTPYGTYSFAWTPTAEGTYQITASWLGDDAYNGAQSTPVTVTVSVPVPPTPPSITLSPTSGPVGTKVTVTGSNFNSTSSQYTSGYLGFDDQLVGLIAVNDDGTLNATFNIPASESGLHVVKVEISVVYPTYETITVRANFTVIDTTPLDITADVGSPRIAGESAEFYIQSVFKGVSVNMTLVEATLYKPHGATQTLAVQRIA